LPRVTRGQDLGGVEAVAPLKQSDAGGSGSFLVRANDGECYWCKTLNNLQNEPRVPTNEQLVARLGVLIGAPVCQPELVYIPEALVGWEIRPGSGRLLEEGWAHGSRAVDLAVETRDISMNRAADDNARRQAGIFALHDWCGGSDSQWLMAGPESEFHSHDHGHYFPGGPAWTTATLQSAAETSYALAAPSDGLDAAELELSMGTASSSVAGATPLGRPAFPSQRVLAGREPQLFIRTQPRLLWEGRPAWGALPSPNSAPETLLGAENGSERRVVVRVPVPVPGTRSSRRSRAYDLPVTRERRRPRDQHLAALTGYRVDDGKGERRSHKGEKRTARRHQHRDLLPHRNLLPLVKELFGPFVKT
jgi:hypothetical protein